MSDGDPKVWRNEAGELIGIRRVSSSARPASCEPDIEAACDIEVKGGPAAEAEQRAAGKTLRQYQDENEKLLRALKQAQATLLAMRGAVSDAGIDAEHLNSGVCHAVTKERRRSMKGHWLVEIRLKDWEPALPNGARIVSFEEVLAYDEESARHAGFDQFAARCNYEPVMRRKMASFGITQHNCYAPDAVQV